MYNCPHGIISGHYSLHRLYIVQCVRSPETGFPPDVTLAFPCLQAPLAHSETEDLKEHVF